MNAIFNLKLSVLPKFVVLAPLVVGFAVVGSGLSAQAAPVPGTTETSAASLAQARPTNSPEPASDSQVAQVDIIPGQATRGGSSYIGIGGNIGIGGDSALGEDVGFTVLSKIGLTNRISARPAVVIQDDPIILVPLTYDFSLLPTDAFEEVIPLSPYVGAGVAIETSDDADVGFLLTGGVDYPINERLTATAAVNAAFLDNVDVGLTVGVGYNFIGF